MNTGGTTALRFLLRTDDTVEHCYGFASRTSPGWSHSPLTHIGPCLDAGASYTHTVNVSPEGTVQPASGTTQDGRVAITFTSSSRPGTPVITAESDNGATGTTEVRVSEPAAASIALDVAESTLVADRQSTTTLTVRVAARNGRPEDVADVVLFFASEQAHWLTGQHPTSGATIKRHSDRPRSIVQVSIGR